MISSAHDHQHLASIFLTHLLVKGSVLNFLQIIFNVMRLFNFSLLSVMAFMTLSACKEMGSGSSLLNDTPLPVITGHHAKNPLTRYVVSAQGVTAGKLIKGSIINYAIIQEYDSLKRLLNETNWNNMFRWITHYNSDGQIVLLESFIKDSDHIHQENQYNAQGDLLREFRIEYTGEKIDTILYAYHYQYAPDSNAYLAYRTNNGDTVTRFTMEKKGNQIHKVEEAYPPRGFTSINIQDITRDKDGKIIQIREERINNDYAKDPLDTTISVCKRVYNRDGRLKEERNENDILKPRHVLYKYRNGLILEKVVDGNIISFQQYAMPGPQESMR